MVKIKTISAILFAVLLFRTANSTSLSIGEFYGSTEIDLNDIYGNTTGKQDNEDLIKVSVLNAGNFPQVVSCQVYLPHKSQLVEFDAKNDIESYADDDVHETLLEPATLIKEDLLNEKFEVGMARVSIVSGGSSEFLTTYHVEGSGSISKQVNKFLVLVDLDSDDPENLEVNIDSVNYALGDYPNNAKHTWFIRCKYGFSFNVHITDFDMESELDHLTLISAPAGSKMEIIDKVSSVGITETETNQLLVIFQSDCDTALRGFKAVIKAVRMTNPSETSTVQRTTTVRPKITTTTAVSNTVEGYDCKEIKLSHPSSKSGIYSLTGGQKVVCDMETTGGGWTVFQKRYNGEIDFARYWYDYSKGFGSLDSEFWIGLEIVHELTKKGNNELRFEMETYESGFQYAQYSGFKVGNDTEKYKLNIDYRSYMGDAGNVFSSSYNNSQFSTIDFGYGNIVDDCGGAGNWHYSSSYRAGFNFNGLYGGPDNTTEEFMWWYTYGESYMLKSSRMMFRAIDDL